MHSLYLSEEMVDYIMDNINLALQTDKTDIAWWMRSTSGTFSVKTAWNLLRSRNKKKKRYMNKYGTRKSLLE